MNRFKDPTGLPSGKPVKIIDTIAPVAQLRTHRIINSVIGETATIDGFIVDDRGVNVGLLTSLEMSADSLYTWELLYGADLPDYAAGIAFNTDKDLRLMMEEEGESSLSGIEVQTYGILLKTGSTILVGRIAI